MCAAPILAKILFKVFHPLLNFLHVDTAMVGGMFFATDMGGFSIVKQMTIDVDIQLISGIFLSSTLGFIIIFVIPVLLKMCNEKNEQAVCKGILCGMLASFVCPVVSGICMHISLVKILKNLIPVFIFIALIVFCMLKCLDRLLVVLLKFSKGIESLSLLFLFIASLDSILGIHLIHGLDSLNTQLVLIGQIGIILMGAYPMVYFIQNTFSKPIQWIARLLHVSDLCIGAMIASLANPIPAFEMVNDMDSKDIVVSVAFLCGAAACLGDYLGFLTPIFPSAIVAMIIGKIFSGVFACTIALVVAY